MKEKRSCCNLREKTVEDTLAGQERIVGSELLSHRSHLTYGPNLHKSVLGLLTLEIGLEDDVLNATNELTDGRYGR